MSLNLFFSSSLFSWEITKEEAQHIGHRIFLNECAGKIENLVCWNEGEHFASVGIGHFIWAPKEAVLPFEETFPSLVAFFEAQGITLPTWLKKTTSCPWNSRQEFLDPASCIQKKELQTLLSQTKSLQAIFIAKRWEETVQKIIFELSPLEKEKLLSKIHSISESAQGRYALIDYQHFKGVGTLNTERYCGEGWGLKQVLEEMPYPTKDPLLAFSETAKKILRRRVHNAPTDRHEERWLLGWLNRIDSYTHPFELKT